MDELKLRRVVAEQVRRVLQEGPGIPGYAATQVAAETRENIKSYLMLHMQMTNQSRSQMGERLASVNAILDELEEEVRDVIEEKLRVYMNKS